MLSSHKNVCYVSIRFFNLKYSFNLFLRFAISHFLPSSSIIRNSLNQASVTGRFIHRTCARSYCTSLFLFLSLSHSHSLTFLSYLSHFKLSENAYSSKVMLPCWTNCFCSLYPLSFAKYVLKMNWNNNKQKEPLPWSFDMVNLYNQGPILPT